MCTAVGFDEIIEGRDKVSHTNRNGIDKLPGQQKLGRFIIIIKTYAITPVLVRPELVNPRETSTQLETVSLDTLRDLRVVSTNTHRNATVTPKGTYRLARLMQAIAVRAVLAIIRGGITRHGKGTQRDRVTLVPVTNRDTKTRHAPCQPT